jgi:rhamnose transport system ATP-binding protein
LGPLLQLADISKSFAGVHALQGVSFELRAGEVHALVGENGAGKSTLIKIITGAHRPDAGTLEIQGQEITDNDPVRARALGVAAIYQQPALFPDLTVAENIALGLEPPGPWRRIRWAEGRRRARALLDRIGAAIDPEAEVRRLTMPQQQLVEIARALGADARILIMDEPTASLSDQEVEHLFGVIRELRGHGVGIIYISHRLAELPQVADRVTALRDGQWVGTRRLSEVSRAELIRMMVGRELSAVFPKTTVSLGDVLLEVEGLYCRQSGIHNVNLSVRAGEILGLAGLVGAGRTELARVLFGLTPADAGTIRLRGQEVTMDIPAQAVELGIAYLPEDRRRHGVILDLPVAANATLAVLRQLSTGGFLSFQRERDLAADYVGRLGIKTPSVATPVGNLSGGNQQKVALARWLAAKPAVLILDEPTQGIDVAAKAEIHRLMGELAAKGLAILMISSELPEILGMSDRIAVMRNGTVAGVFDRGAVTQESLLEHALGHAAESAVPQVMAPSPDRVTKTDQVVARSPDRAAAADRRSPFLSETCGHSEWRGRETSPQRRETSPQRAVKERYRRELSVATAFLLLLVVLAVRAPGFFAPDQLRTFIVNCSPVLVAAVGMTLVILARQIDISIGSQFCLCGVAAGLLARAGLPMTVVVLGTLICGAALGALNGVLVAGLGLPSIVVTLATLVIFRESLRWAREGEFVRNLPDGFQWFGVGQARGQWLVVAVALIVFLVFAWSLRHLAAGRTVYATGSDPEAARLAGIRPRRVIFGVFLLMGLLTGLAALLNAIRFPVVDPNSGNGLELQAIAAVVVGGVAISGGRGTLFGSLIGVLLLGSIAPALVFLHANAEWEKAVQGFIILAAVASDGFAERMRHES